MPPRDWTTAVVGPEWTTQGLVGRHRIVVAAPEAFSTPSNEGGDAMHRVARTLAGCVIALSVLVGTTRQASAFCLFNCTYTKTKYPIVLEHGLAGFDELFGVYELLVRHRRRARGRRRHGVHHHGEPVQLDRGARRAAHRSDRADRRASPASPRST